MRGGRGGDEGLARTRGGCLHKTWQNRGKNEVRPGALDSRRRILQSLKPYAEEPVVDRVPGVCSVEEIALPQLGGGGADGRSGWKCVASDEISCRYGFCRPFPADGLENGLFGGCLASEEVEVEWLRLQDELVNGIRYYIEEQKEDAHDGPARTGLGDWLESISLLSAADKEDGGDKASLMTSHCSKGLEFPVVYIAGVEEGLYPSLRDDSSDFDLEEERRLFYVSVTRAKDELVLNSCDNRWQYGNMKECEESRFINEMLPLDDE